MAAVSAGWKRSYHEMTGAASDSSKTSRVHSPLGTPACASSRPPDLLSGSRLIAPGVSIRRTTFEPTASIVIIGLRVSIALAVTFNSDKC